MKKSSLLFLALCAATLSTNALGASLYVKNAHSSCHGQLTVMSFEPNDAVSAIPHKVKYAKNGETINISCKHKKRCKLTWNDNQGGSYDSATINKRENSSADPFIPEC